MDTLSIWVIANIILLRGSMTKKSTFNRLNSKFMLLMPRKMDKTNTSKCMKIRIRRQMIKLKVRGNLIQSREGKRFINKLQLKVLQTKIKERQTILVRDFLPHPEDNGFFSQQHNCVMASKDER